MVKLRLRRMGGNRKPFYRIIAADVRSANGGSFIEEIGWYDPKKKTDNFQLDLARATYWTQHGAIPSETVNSLIQKAHIAAAANAAKQ